jgi:hypothetical protein
MAANELTAADVADIIERFIEGSGAPLDWDEYTLGTSFRDERLERIRKRCARLSEEFPPPDPTMYCSEEGIRVLRSLVKELRGAD